jgi:phenylacetic acid degradation operon negative regulatory protein
MFSVLTSTSPTLSQRHAAGAASARGLLFTVLGELVLPAGDSAWTGSLLDVLGRLGVAENAARQALRRTAADGWIAPERRGRRTRWELTAAGMRLLTDGARRIYTFAPVGAEWDGKLLLVLARVPESERAARHLLRTRLAWAGLGSPASGVWISTHTERLAEAEGLLRRAEIDDAMVFTARHRGGVELSRLIRQAWDLDTLEAGYEDFLGAFAELGAADPLTRVVELVHAWRRFPSIDPALPRELLPPRWSGEQAAKLFAERHAAWTAGAAAAWATLDHDG